MSNFSNPGSRVPSVRPIKGFKVVCETEGHRASGEILPFIGQRIGVLPVAFDVEDIPVSARRPRGMVHPAQSVAVFDPDRDLFQLGHGGRGHNLGHFGQLVLQTRDHYRRLFKRPSVVS